MPIKSELIKMLDKISETEELFLLRAQDESAPSIVMKWIDENLYTAPEAKIRNAIEVAIRMSKQEDVMRKRAD